MMTILDLTSISGTEEKLLASLFEAYPQLHLWQAHQTYVINENGDSLLFNYDILRRRRTHNKPGERFEIIGSKLLGIGAQGAVLPILATLAYQNQTVRVKHKSRAVKIEPDAGLLRNEHKIAKIAEPRLHVKVPIIANNTGYLVMNKLDFDNLETILYNDLSGKNSLTFKQRKLLSLRIAEGVQKLHQKGVIHRDIKPSNILVDLDCMDVYFIDYGYSKFCWVDDNKFPGTVNFAPWEGYKGESSNEKGDVFAAGRTIAMLWRPNLDLYNLSVAEAGDYSKQVNYDELFIGLEPISQYEGELIHTSLLKMVAPHPVDRPSMDEIVKQFKKLNASHRLAFKKTMLTPYINWKLKHTHSPTNIEGYSASDLSFARASSEINSFERDLCKSELRNINHYNELLQQLIVQLADDSDSLCKARLLELSNFIFEYNNEPLNLAQINEFKTFCLSAIHLINLDLKDYHKKRMIAGNVLLVIVGLGIIYAAALPVHKQFRGHYTFFKPSIKDTLHRIEKEFEKIEKTCQR